jgi:hypothetical protein
MGAVVFWVIAALCYLGIHALAPDPSPVENGLALLSLLYLACCALYCVGLLLYRLLRPLLRAILAMARGVRARRADRAARRYGALVHQLADPSLPVHHAALRRLARTPARRLAAVLDHPAAAGLWKPLLDGLLLSTAPDTAHRVLHRLVRHERGQPLAANGDLDRLRRTTVLEQAWRCVSPGAGEAPAAFRRGLAAAAGRSIHEMANAPSRRLRMDLRRLEHVCELARLHPDGSLVRPLRELAQVLRPVLQLNETVLLEQRDERYRLEKAAACMLSALGAGAARAAAPLDEDEARVAGARARADEAARGLAGMLAAHRGLLASRDDPFGEHAWDGDDGSEHPSWAARDPFRGLSIGLSAAQIQGLRGRHDQFSSDLWSRMSPVSLLLQVAEGDQAFATFVRQGAIQGLACVAQRPELSEAGRERIRDRVTAVLQAGGAAPIRTWEVRLPEDGCLAEAALALHAGLSWMADNVAGGAPPAVPHLLDTVRQIRAHVPDAVRFLQRCPLRLMTLADRLVLGECEVQGYQVLAKTRFTPPAGTGPVRSREVLVEDLTEPNRMGVALQLFQHPLLLLPTLYHEALHAEGLVNEAEVHLREALFLRALLAQHAPRDDAGLPAWERRVSEILSSAGRRAMTELVLLDWERPAAIDLLNGYVQRVYGPRLNGEQAALAAEAEVDRVDGMLARANTSPEVLSWCPEMPFPLLAGPGSTPASRAQAERLTSIVVRRCTAPRSIESLDEVVERGGPLVRLQMEQWDAYRRRPHALTGLHP